ncbi:hypothetical protein [Methylomagnum sp.]
MATPDSKDPPVPPSPHADAAPAVEPSWKPLLWFGGGLAIIIGLGEVFFDLLLEVLEMFGEAIFFAVEGSEEILEDKIEEWFELDPYHAEIVTAWTMSPVKLFLAFLALRWLWRHSHSKLFPKIRAYLHRQYTAVRLAWQALAWYYKIPLVVVVLGILVILI